MVYAIEIPCPSCGANANQWCSNRSTLGARQPLLMHPTRYREASAQNKNRD